MDPLHLHLYLNHVPVVGAIGCVLLLAAGLVRQSRDVMAAALVALLLVALVAIPVYLTGEPSEERAESIAGVSEANIERHEDAAKVAFIGIELTGVIALVSLIIWWFRQSPLLAPIVVTLAVALISAILIARAAALGGEIRHSELRDATIVDGGGEIDD